MEHYEVYKITITKTRFKIKNKKKNLTEERYFINNNHRESTNT